MESRTPLSVAMPHSASSGSMTSPFLMQWYTNEDEWLDEEPCMFISCPSRSKSRVHHSAAGLASIRHGNRQLRCPQRGQVALRIANHIGVDPTSRSSMHAIMDVLYENLPDLLKMPPKPDGMRRTAHTSARQPK